MDRKFSTYKTLSMDQLRKKYHETDDINKKKVLKQIYKDKKNKMIEEQMIKQMLLWSDNNNCEQKPFVRVPYGSVEKQYMDDIMKDTNNNKMMERMESEIIMRKNHENNRGNKKKFCPPYREHY